jgi:hypothetical protein
VPLRFGAFRARTAPGSATKAAAGPAG